MDRLRAAIEKALEKALEPLAQLRKKLEFIEGQNRRLFFSTSTYVGDFTSITWITSGQRIFVDTRDLGIAQHLMFKGYWEKTSNQAMLSLLDAQSVYVDVGAHYGYHVITAAQKAATVVAVEPNPRLHGLLEKSIRINGLRSKVTLHRCAVSDQEGEARFVCPQDDPALGHLAAPDEAPDATLVRIRPLDAILLDLPRIDLLKIDVEGHELEALRGAEKTLAKHPDLKIAIEYAPGHIERTTTLEEFHGVLLGYGFTHVAEIDRAGKLKATSYDQLGANRVLRNLVLSRRAL